MKEEFKYTLKLKFYAKKIPLNQITFQPKEQTKTTDI